MRTKFILVVRDSVSQWHKTYAFRIFIEPNKDLAEIVPTYARLLRRY